MRIVIGLLSLTLVASCSIADNKPDEYESNRLTASSLSNVDTRQPFIDWYEEAVASGFSGMVLVAQGQTKLFEQGLGYADKEAKRPFTADTVVDILSMTKQFTSAAILKLEEQGALSVHDTLEQFFNNVPTEKQGITLHQLLTHTAGLKANYKGDYTPATRQQLEQHALNSRLRSRPGETFNYSNIGYSLLALVIEKASNKSYEAFLHEHLFLPAGMNNTGYRIPSWSEQDFIVGYQSDSRYRHHRLLAGVGSVFGRSDRWGTPLEQSWAKDGPWWSLHGNGGLLSTLNDLHLWYLALANNSILSETSKDKLYSPYVEVSSGIFYGYGWMVRANQAGTRRIINHGGANDFFDMDIYNYVDDGVVFLYVTNTPLQQSLMPKLSNVVRKEYIQ